MSMLQQTQMFQVQQSLLSEYGGCEATQMCTSLFVTPYSQSIGAKMTAQSVNTQPLLKVLHSASSAIFFRDTVSHLLNSDFHGILERKCDTRGKALCGHLLERNRHWASPSFRYHLLQS
jgi:hypothetical protein